MATGLGRAWGTDIGSMDPIRPSRSVTRADLPRLQDRVADVMKDSHPRSGREWVVMSVSVVLIGVAGSAVSFWSVPLGTKLIGGVAVLLVLRVTGLGIQVRVRFRSSI